MFTVACNAGNGRGFILVVCCAFWLVTPIVSAYPIIQKDTTQPTEVSTVISAFEQRAHAVRTGRFVWKEALTAFPSAMLDPKVGLLPKSIIRQFNDGITFQFDSNRFLYKYHLIDFQGTGRSYPLSAHSFDGENVASYHPPVLQLTYGEAQIHSLKDFREFQNFNIWPFLFTYRALPTRGVGLAGARLRVVSSQNVQEASGPDKLKADIVDLEWATKDSIRHFLLDRKRAFRLVRFEQLNDIQRGEVKERVPYAELLIDAYVTDQESGVDVPKSWTLRFFGSTGKPIKESVCTLTEHSINVESGLEPFSLIPFPVGTLVEDEKRGIKAWQREGGKLEVIVPQRAIPPLPKR
jgi:hypothetical protein